MTQPTSSGIDGSQCLAFAGRGRDLHVRLAAETAPDDLAWAIGLFLPRWPPDAQRGAIIVHLQDVFTCTDMANYLG